MSEDEAKKIVVVGDGACGKTSLLIVYVENKFPEEYIPTVFDSHIKEIVLDEKPITVHLMDTSGQEDYERLRALQYLNTDAFILCFAIDNRTSFENVKAKWIKDIKRFKVPVVLVATKLDLRDEENTQTTITTLETKKLAKRIKACSFVECSAKDGFGVHEVFETAAIAALNPKQTRQCNVI